MLFCILLASSTTIASSVFLRFIIDNGITPLIGVENPSFDYFFRTVPLFAGILLIGVFAMYYYSKQMVIIIQKILKTLRNEMIIHMKSIPLILFEVNGY